MRKVDFAWTVLVLVLAVWNAWQVDRYRQLRAAAERVHDCDSPSTCDEAAVHLHEVLVGP